jgi:hypothetical protein
MPYTEEEDKKFVEATVGSDKLSPIILYDPNYWTFAYSAEIRFDKSKVTLEELKSLYEWIETAMKDPLYSEKIKNAIIGNE